MKTRPCALAAAAVTLFAAAGAHAADLRVSPNPAVVNQPVTVTVTQRYAETPNASEACNLSLMYGDEVGVELPASVRIECNLRNPCVLTATHRYALTGTYTVRARSFCPLSSPLGDPSPAIQLSVLATPAPAGGTVVRVSPASFAVPRGRTSAYPSTWSVTGASAGAVSATSPGGEFLADGASLGRGGGALTVALAGGAGSATETISVPVAVVERALERGASRFEYVRVFSVGAATARAAAALTVASATTAEFALRRVSLFFGDRRASVSVRRGEAGLTATAEVSTYGSGLLQGHWEVDGRVLAPPVTRQLSAAETARFTSPELPTYDPVTHAVRFVVTSPAPDGSLPTIAYQVRPSDALPTPSALKLLAPEDAAALPYGPASFRWEAAPGTSVYLVQFLGAEGEEPLFSALTRAAEYRLPELLFRETFRAGARYRWRVTGYGDGEAATAESPGRAFSFSAP